ncbi:MULTISPECIES: hypothetical protein [unclassified Bradyrhizobium]|uniref:hypothetical protein n=1 Tax=unclassified Bradyrhizobium TaxID=2631580 RepID=UPI00247965D6|nr:MULTISPECIES: hypothetical protein [unclassified Bradyrhizobium]WGS19163.1 hypothetical protein MTX22_32620 [Bradyrhizobium sp. ISRA463]WGS26000.1 hypothetical protein MTX19_30165 [Bradyrhizobium sp. ISRA464]
MQYLNNGLSTVAILEARVFERLGTVHEEPTEKTISFAGDPVATLFLPTNMIRIAGLNAGSKYSMFMIAPSHSKPQQIGDIAKQSRSCSNPKFANRAEYWPELRTRTGYADLEKLTSSTEHAGNLASACRRGICGHPAWLGVRDAWF